MDFKMKEQILTKELVEQIDLILFSHNNDASQLVGILLDIQAIIPRQYIPVQVHMSVAKARHSWNLLKGKVAGQE